MKVFYDQDASLDLLKDKQIAILVMAVKAMLIH